MDDIDRIMVVMEAAFDPAFGEAWNRRQLTDALVMPGCFYLLAEEEGAEARGFTLSRRVLDEEELLLVAVHPDYRAQGIGQSLLTRLLDQAKRDGMSRLFLEMRDGNPAESLYRRHGFQAVGRRKGYYRRGTGKPFDAITFSLNLPPEC